MNEEIEDIMKVVKSHEQSRLLIQGISETIKYESKEQKGEFLPMFLEALAASILGNAFTGGRLIGAEHFFNVAPSFN